VSNDLAPRHLQLRELLFRRWKTNGMRPGDRIESQNEIVRFCDYSLITVTKTLKDLESEGILRRQVGRGSFLERAPWTEAHHRVGFFYNRDVVGGGIFNNDFYTKLVMAFEKRIMSDGHEFILGSFTHDKMPMAVWDALDVIILTSITAETRLEFLDEASSQISVIDQTLVHPKVHSYRVAYRDAFRAMFAHFGGQALTYLYLDSEIASNEQQFRREAAEVAFGENSQGNALEIIKVNQEMGAQNVSVIEDAIARYDPDVVFGYTHPAWVPLINERTKPGAHLYKFLLDSDGPGFVVHTEEWTQGVLPTIYANLEDRRAAGAVHSFPARFQP